MTPERPRETGAHALLLTGIPGTGKTTVVKEVAAALSDSSVSGFVTVEIRESGRRVGFELSTFAGHRQVLAHVDIESRHRVSRYGVDVAGFDRIVEEVLHLDERADVYLIDEIGKMECFSAAFCSAVRKLLDSGKPLVATVALRGRGFIAEVKRRPDAELWEVTKANRDEMPGRIVTWLSSGPARGGQSDESAR